VVFFVTGRWQNCLGSFVSDLQQLLTKKVVAKNHISCSEITHTFN
jgi:hypothetical protein